MSRPFSVSVISVIAVLYGALTFIPKILVVLPSEQDSLGRELLNTMSAQRPIPLPLWLHLSHGLIGSGIWIVAGLFLWRGANWSRWLMVFWGLTVLFLTFSVYGFSGSFLWKFGTYLLLLYFLTKSNSRG